MILCCMFCFYKYVECLYKTNIQQIQQILQQILKQSLQQICEKNLSCIVKDAFAIFILCYAHLKSVFDTVYFTEFHNKAPNLFAGLNFSQHL